MIYPKSLLIETSSICDLKCVMCPHSLKEFGRPELFLSDFIIDKISNYVSNAELVQLHGIGEPLLSPSFWKVLKLVNKNCHTSVNSNFLNVPEYKMIDLVDSNLKHLSISIDSPDVSTYYKIRGGDLNKVIKNIKNLIKIIKEKKSLLLVTLNMTLMKENINQLEKALDLCNELECFGLDTWPMNNIDGKDYNGNQRWNFNYNEQLPNQFKELYNEKIISAISYAKKINNKRFLYKLL